MTKNQSNNLIPVLSVYENIELPMQAAGVSIKKREARVKELLEMAGLTEFMNLRPTELSMGDQQRVAILVALSNKPSVVLADEPTGNLDSRTAHEIFDLFSGLVDQGKTLLVVTHDKEIASRATRVIEMADGQITAGQIVNA